MFLMSEVPLARSVDLTRNFGRSRLRPPWSKGVLQRLGEDFVFGV